MKRMKMLLAGLFLVSGAAFGQAASYTVTEPTLLPKDPATYTIRYAAGVGTDFNADGSVHGYVVATTGFTICSGRGCQSHPFQTLWAMQWAADGSAPTALDWCWKTDPTNWRARIVNPAAPAACNFPAPVADQIVVDVVPPIGHLPAAGLYYYNLVDTSPDGSHLLGTINGTTYLLAVAPSTNSGILHF